MSVEFRNLDVLLENSALHIAGEMATGLRKRGCPRTAGQLGYHLFDDPTGTLVVDGERHSAASGAAA